MPFALVTVGLLLVVTGVRNTYADFGAQIKSDFTGANNFTYWLAALGIIGAVGYVDRLRVFANMFMALIILAMVLKNGGVFDKFKAALDTGPQSPTANVQAANINTTPQIQPTAIAQSTQAANAARDQGYIQDAWTAIQTVGMFA